MLPARFPTRLALAVGLSLPLVSLASSAQADPLGACCFLDGSCEVLTLAECHAHPGYCAWTQSPTCNPYNCGPPASCCFPNGECLMIPARCCSALGGTQGGEGTTCDPPPCESLFGVCCYDGGYCALVTWPECVALAEGTSLCAFWSSEPIPCDPNPCPCCCQYPCCLPDGSCMMVWTGECEVLNGEWMYGEIACYPNPCLTSGVPAEPPDPELRSRSWGKLKEGFR